MAGISFAGDGQSDVSINVSNTGNSDYGKSETTAIEFAGDGAKDVSHSFDTQTGNQAMPGGKGEIQMTGDN